MLTVDDAIVRDDGSVKLVAYVEREPILGLRQDVEDAEVRFFVEGVKVAEDDTDDDGRASERCELPQAGASHFEARATVEGRRLRASARIFKWHEDRTIIAVDVDDTLCETEYRDLILEDEDDDSDPLKRSRKTLRRLSSDYHIVYVTARPRFLLEKTRRWLEEHDFPRGPVIAAPGLRQAARPKAFKCRTLRAFRKKWPNLLIGIGDKPSDAAAYGSNKMLALIVARRPEAACGAHAIVVRDWRSMAKFFSANRETLTDPDRLEDAIKGKIMLRRPVIAWDDD